MRTRGQHYCGCRAARCRDSKYRRKSEKLPLCSSSAAAWSLHLVGGVNMPNKGARPCTCTFPCFPSDFVPSWVHNQLSFQLWSQVAEASPCISDLLRCTYTVRARILEHDVISACLDGVVLCSAARHAAFGEEIHVGMLLLSPVRTRLYGVGHRPPLLQRLCKRQQRDDPRFH